MRGRGAGILVALFCVALLGACGGSVDTGTDVRPHAGQGGLPEPAPLPGTSHKKKKVHPSGYFSFKPPIVPIQFSVDSSLHFSIGVSTSQIVTPIGSIEIGGGVARSADPGRPIRVLPPSPYGTTRLIICQQGTSGKTCQGYEIDTGRKLNIDMDGHFQETVERNQITIDAAPGSVLTLSDAGTAVQAGPHPPARVDIEEFDFSAQSKDTVVDLERGLGGTTNDLSYDHMTGELKPVNGAMITDIEQYKGKKGHLWAGDGMPKMELPSENDCAQTAPARWQSGFTAANLSADIIVSCVGTAEGDFGYLVIGRNRNVKPTSYYVYSYMWVR